MDEKIKSLIDTLGKSATDPFIREKTRAELDFHLLSELSNRLGELATEIGTARTQLKESSDAAATHAAALVIWSRVLVFVTSVYVLITAGLLWAAWTK